MTFVRPLTGLLIFLVACASKAPGDTQQREAEENARKDAGGSETVPPGSSGGTEEKKDPPDAGAPEAAPPSGPDPFAGAPPYAGKAPTTTAKSRHLVDVTGKNCLQCHGIFATPFAFAGTAYDSQGQAAPGTEVRVIGEDGKEIGLATTDPDGNFWSIGFATPGTPAITGVRTAKGATRMSDKITVTGCNASSCHDGSRPLKAF